ncbi:MAG: MFS transporter [Proteobacteria bacterium]|nr:MFS transporter [Pseudomonadota bacterium]HQR03084.1 MFS transporter [Rhodocyclaceae bacterium]
MFYGWRIVAVALLAQAVSAGITSYSYGLLVLPISAEFGASRMEMMWGMTGSSLIAIFISPTLGSFVDRYSARWLMAAGGLSVGVALGLISRAGNVWEFILAFALGMAPVSVLIGPLGTSAVVARWFNRHRGRALSLTALGTSVGGLLIPYLFQILIDDLGWREACFRMGLIMLAVSLPPILLVVRNHPDDLGLQPDGLPPSETSPAAAMVSRGAIEHLFRHGPFWRIGISVGSMFAVFSVLLANLVPFAIGHGIAAKQATLLISVIALAGVIGKLLFSVVADRVNLKGALLATMVMVGVSLLALIRFGNIFDVMLVCSVFIGLALGGLLPAWSAILAQIYGPANFGRVMGRMQPVTIAMVSLAVPLTGYLFDRTGNYTAAFVMLCGLILVAAAALMPMRTTNDQ